jgi:hypothetical protein
MFPMYKVQEIKKQINSWTWPALNTEYLGKKWPENNPLR